jgi:hypothetical protein
MKDFNFIRYLTSGWNFIIYNQKAIASLGGNINLLGRQYGKSTVQLMPFESKTSVNRCKLRHNHQSQSRRQVPALCLCFSVRVCVHRNQCVICTALNLIKNLHADLPCFDSSQNYEEWKSAV